MANPRVNENLVIENARLLFRNFSGRESKYNRAGQRNFCVYIEDAADAQKLIDDGWNVRVRPPREDGEEPRYYIQVAVSFENIPPTVYMITKRKKVKLDEESIEVLPKSWTKVMRQSHFEFCIGQDLTHSIFL